MSTMLATLCLNEMEWLPKLYLQHKDWPALKKWVFVEAADVMYAKANPSLVTKDGLSTDGTSEFLKALALEDERVIYIPYGFTSAEDPAQGKVAARNAYMEAADEIQPYFVMVLDADEFYTRADQVRIVETMCRHTRYHAFRFGQREIWRPESIADQPLFQYQVTGQVFSVTHVRGWRWAHGVRYRDNHNYLSFPNGERLTRALKRCDLNPALPECIHLGFASKAIYRNAKNRYYVERGEGVTDHRQKYVDARNSFATWIPGAAMPHGCEVIPYTGPIPEVFTCET